MPVRSAPSEVPERRLVVAGLLVLVLLGLGLTSMAVFSDTTDTSGLEVAVGTLDIATAPVSVAVSGSGLEPGDVVADELVVRNDGSVQLRYAISSVTTEDTLASALELEIRVGVSDCSSAGADVDGTLVAGPVPLGSTGGSAILGDPAQGADAGDRTLAGGSAETLCLRVALPDGADEDVLADRTTTAVFTFDAEQTGANP